VYVKAKADGKILVLDTDELHKVSLHLSFPFTPSENALFRLRFMKNWAGPTETGRKSLKVLTGALRCGL
jgi:hypothetical protein